eukprot:11559198-Alexandrium_andersonii.AAC.1
MVGPPGCARPSPQVHRGGWRWGQACLGRVGGWGPLVAEGARRQASPRLVEKQSWSRAGGLRLMSSVRGRPPFWRGVTHAIVGPDVRLDIAWVPRSIPPDLGRGRAAACRKATPAAFSLGGAPLVREL